MEIKKNEEFGENNTKNYSTIFIYFWDNLEKFIGFVTLFSMTIITFVQVVGRYAFSHSLFWSEEAARFLLVWITFAGSAYAFKRGAHIGVDFVVDRLSGKIKLSVKIFSKIVTIAFFCLLLYYGAIHTIAQIGTRLSPAMRISMAIPYSAIPIGSFFVIIRLIDLTILEIKSFKQKGEA